MTTLLHRLRVLWFILRVWNKAPDWRLAQLVGNMHTSTDPYYMSDSLLVGRLKATLSHLGK